MLVSLVCMIGSAIELEKINLNLNIVLNTWCWSFEGKLVVQSCANGQHAIAECMNQREY